MSPFDLIALALLALIFVVPLRKRVPSRMVWLIAMLPVLNVVTDLTYDLPASTARSVLVPLRVAVLLVVGLYCLLRTPRHSPVTYAIVGFLFYLILLVLWTSNPAGAADAWLRHLVLMLLFVVGYRSIRDLDSLRVLNLGLLISTGLLLLNFVLAQVFSFGRSPYRSEADVYLGAGGIHLVNNFVYFALLVPVLLLLSRGLVGRYAAYVGGLLSSIAVLLVMKRISIAALGAGVLVYLIFAPAKERRVAALLATLGVLAILSPFYIDTFLARSYRITNTELEVGKHATDFDLLVSEWEASDYAPKIVLVGQELFLSRSNFGGRKIHNDYFALLYGGGAIGLTLYLLVFISLFACHRVRGSPVRGFVTLRELRAVYCGLVVACFIIGWSSGMAAITPRGLLFLYVGAIAGVIDQQKWWAKVLWQLDIAEKQETGPIRHATLVGR